MKSCDIIFELTNTKYTNGGKWLKMVRIFREVVKKKRSFYCQADRKGLPPPPPYGQGVVIFQNKLTYLDFFLMGKVGQKISHLLTVRAEGSDPPSPLTVSLTVKKTVFFLTTALSFQ